MDVEETLWDSDNTRIVVDSSSNVPAELLAQYDMIEVPTLVNFGTESYRNNVDMSVQDFYQRFAESDKPPTTSQPPPTYFADAYRAAFAGGAQHIIVVTVSRQVSGTFASAQSAVQVMAEQGNLVSGTTVQDHEDARFLFWDGESISMGSGWQAIAAARMLTTGLTRSTLVERLSALRAATIGYATLDTLKYAALSGRVGNLQAGIGDLLHVKAILEIGDGVVVNIARARGRKRALRDIVDRLVARLGTEPANVAFLHANAPEDAQRVLAATRERMTISEAYVGDIGPAIASFGGPGALGIVGHPARLG